MLQKGYERKRNGWDQDQKQQRAKNGRIYRGEIRSFIEGVRGSQTVDHHQRANWVGGYIRRPSSAPRSRFFFFLSLSLSLSLSFSLFLFSRLGRNTKVKRNPRALFYTPEEISSDSLAALRERARESEGKVLPDDWFAITFFSCISPQGTSQGTFQRVNLLEEYILARQAAMAARTGDRIWTCLCVIKRIRLLYTSVQRSAWADTQTRREECRRGLENEREKRQDDDKISS